MLVKLGRGLVDSDEVLYIYTDGDTIEVMFKDKRKLTIDSSQPATDMEEFLTSLRDARLRNE